MKDFKRYPFLLSILSILPTIRSKAKISSKTLQPKFIAGNLSNYEMCPKSNHFYASIVYFTCTTDCNKHTYVFFLNVAIFLRDTQPRFNFERNHSSRRGCSLGAKRFISRLRRNISPLIDQFRTKSIEACGTPCHPAAYITSFNTQNTSKSTHNINNKLVHPAIRLQNSYIFIKQMNTCIKWNRIVDQSFILIYCLLIVHFWQLR